MRRRLDRLALSIGLLVMAGLFLLFETRPAQISAVEEAIFDQYQRWQPRPYNPESPVRVIDIDEASLSALGQWPWPRTFLAELIVRVANAGAKAIAFDMTFAEPDRTSPAILVPSLQRFGDDYSAVFADPGVKRGTGVVPDHDAIFGWVIGLAPIVLGVIASDESTQTTLPAAVPGISVSGDTDGLGDALTRFSGVIANLPVLVQDASGVGTISLSKTESDVIRRVPLVMMVGERRVPTLSIEALRVGQGAGSHILKTTTGSGETDLRGQARTVSMRVGDAVVPLDGDGTLRVRYSGAVSERVIPAHRILDIGGLSDDIAADLAGKFVFVGASAAVLFDVKTTPLTPRISGVHVHAEIVEQILDGAYLTNPDWAPGMERLAMVVAGLAVVVLLSLGMAWWGLGVMVAAVGSITVGSWFAFSELDMLLSPAFSSFGVLMPYLAVSGYKFFTAEASRREITRQFEHFVAPEVIQDIIDDPQSHLTPGGAQRDLSIMFLDVRRFSTITEKMDPQEVIAFINTLLTPLTDAIIDEEGTIDKYMGDAVMAFWNAPRRTDDHAGHAVRAMLAFNPVMDRLNAGFARQGLPEIDIGVGINTGECSVGNMGSLKRLAYSCVGDSVNLAARLEGQTKAYGVRNLVGSATAALVRGRFALFELDQVAVKGRGQPEAIYTVAGDKSVLSSPLCGELTQHLARARAGYLARDWEGAESAYDLAATVGSVGCFDPQPLARIMKQRIDQYRADPPPVDWDGVFIATSK